MHENKEEVVRTNPDCLAWRHIFSIGAMTTKISPLNGAKIDILSRYNFSKLSPKTVRESNG